MEIFCREELQYEEEELSAMDSCFCHGDDIN